MLSLELRLYATEGTDSIKIILTIWAATLKLSTKLSRMFSSSAVMGRGWVALSLIQRTVHQNL
jgi:hypothetical protein